MKVLKTYNQLFEKYNLLLNAIEIFDYDAIIRYARKYDINDFNETLPLAWAVDGTDIKTIQLLIDLGVDVNLQNKNGDTALHFVSTLYHENELKPSLNIFSLLIKNDADPSIKNNNDFTVFDDIYDSYKNLILINMILEKHPEMIKYCDYIIKKVKANEFNL